VGDGGSQEFGTELAARLADTSRPRFEELEAKESTAGLSVEESIEQLGLT